MRRRWVGTWVAALGVIAGACPSLCAGVWSPNGRWVAYAQGGGSRPSTASGGWLISRSEASGPDRAAPGRDEDRSYRLWVTQVETDAAVLLDESRGPITEPGWNPDGTALAFGKIVIEPDGTARYDVIVQDAPERKRVLASRNLGDSRRGLAVRARGAVAWSPDGRHLVVPWPQPTGLAVLRAEDGRILKVLEHASHASWSPDGAWLAYFSSGPSPSLWVLDQHLGPPRQVTAWSGLGQAPVWSRDARSLYHARVVDRHVKVVRIRLDSGQVEWNFDALGHPLPEGQELGAIGLSADAEVEQLFVALPVREVPQAVAWVRPARGEVQDRIVTFDIGVPNRDLALAPNARKLFVRLGPDADLGPCGLYDLVTRKLIPLTPDAGAREVWLSLIAETSTRMIRERLGPPRIGEREVERPTILPVPGELEAQAELAIALRRMGRLGEPIDALGSASEPNSNPGLDEVRLALSYFQGEYSRCLDLLDALERRADSSDRRLRLLGLRAQLYLAQGDADRARAILDYLRSRSGAARHRVEEGSDGNLRLVDDPSPTALWTQFLYEKARDLRSRQKSEIPQGNPDNPNADLNPLDLVFPNDALNRKDDIPPARPPGRLLPDR